MYLKKAFWNEVSPPSSPAAAKHQHTGLQSSTPQSDTDAAASTAVDDLVNSLNEQRIYREITLGLRTGLRDAAADFSFLRVRGLRSLLKILRSVAQSDSTIQLFYHSQTQPDLQVVPVLFKHSFKEDTMEEKVLSLNHIFSVEPMKITSSSSNAEIALALRVLEGCCLLHSESTILAHKNKAIQVLLKILSNKGELEQGACLDALIAIMLDSSSNQMDFEEYHGIEEVADLLRDKQVDESLRLRCGEFLLLLIGHVNGREGAPMATVHEDIKRLLGERSASLIWAASQFGSTLDPSERQTALHIQAGRVLESLNLY